MVTDPTWIWRDCQHCGTPFAQPDDPGRKRRYCSSACRPGAYRARKCRQEHADRQRQEDDARRGAYEDTGRRQRERARSHQPPPHAGHQPPRHLVRRLQRHERPAHLPPRRRPRTPAPVAATRASGPRPPPPATRTRPTPATPRQTPCATSTASNPSPQKASGTDGTSHRRAAGLPGRGRGADHGCGRVRWSVRPTRRTPRGATSGRSSCSRVLVAWMGGRLVPAHPGRKAAHREASCRQVLVVGPWLVSGRVKPEFPLGCPGTLVHQGKRGCTMTT
jgi:hypothetical protein